ADRGGLVRRGQHPAEHLGGHRLRPEPPADIPALRDHPVDGVPLLGGVGRDLGAGRLAHRAPFLLARSGYIRTAGGHREGFRSSTYEPSGCERRSSSARLPRSGNKSPRRNPQALISLIIRPMCSRRTTTGWRKSAWPSLLFSAVWLECMVKHPCWTNIRRSVSDDITARTLSFSSALSLKAGHSMLPHMCASIGGVTARKPCLALRISGWSTQMAASSSPRRLSPGGAAAIAKYAAISGDLVQSSSLVGSP